MQVLLGHVGYVYFKCPLPFLKPVHKEQKKCPLMDLVKVIGSQGLVTSQPNTDLIWVETGLNCRSWWAKLI